jgi:hypothetical protein
MISPTSFLWGVVAYLAFCGIAYILLAINRSEKTVRSHYGAIEGFAGLIFLGVAVLMVVLS